MEQIRVGCGDLDSSGVDIAVPKQSERLVFDGESPALGRPEDLFVTQEVAMPTAEFWFAFGTGFVIVTRTGTIAKIVKPEDRTTHTGDLEEERVRLAGVAAWFVLAHNASIRSKPCSFGIHRMFSYSPCVRIAPN